MFYSDSRGYVKFTETKGQAAFYSDSKGHVKYYCDPGTRDVLFWQ
jgi:hypothetical protein